MASLIATFLVLAYLLIISSGTTNLGLFPLTLTDKALTVMQLDGTRQVSVDGNASACCDLDL